MKELKLQLKILVILSKKQNEGKNIVNNRMINTLEDLISIMDTGVTIDVEFIFTQSKTSAKFSDEEVNYFFIQVKKFISEETCTIPEISESIGNGKSQLNDTGLLSDKVNGITYNSIGVKEIQKLYRKITGDLEATIKFPKNVRFSYDGDKVTSAHFRLVEIDQFIHLLYDFETNGVKRVFEDNIRDFLGIDSNDVNSSMNRSLNDDEAQLFGILNNGITVVADEIHPVGEKFNLVNYQIVNGCQTSNVILENYENIKGKSITLPIRLIATKDEATKSEIVKATNSQTGLKPEQLDSLNNFHKMLEDYYLSMNKTKSPITRDVNIYYERRTNQYRNSVIIKTRIISIPMQIKAVASMFLNNPHGVSGHYGTVARKLKNKIFSDDHILEAYYVSALMYYRVENFFRKNKDYKEYRRMKWHIMMTVKNLLASKNELNFDLNQKKLKLFSTRILANINKEDDSNELIISAIDYLKKIIKDNDLDIGDRKLFERKETTDLVIRAFNV